MAIMCQGQLQYESIELAYMIDFKSYFASELLALQTLQENGMVVLEDSGLQVTEMGWFFVRAVAMLFDRYLQTDRNRARFSKII
jgi:oxygen-independent coproporphyrinogen-3 oxidase